jgi:uncharacterized protein (TIGR03084 family)
MGSENLDQPAPSIQQGSPSLGDLLGDLEAEHDSLDTVLSGMDPSGWDADTPAEGWMVRDQVSHLAYFDEVAVMAVIDPDRFAVLAEDVKAERLDPMEEHLRRGREMAGDEVLVWWRRARSDMLDTLAALAPGSRIAWFGPPMSPASFVTARLMETWAHGQDVADALGIERVSTGRLRHIAHLGSRTRAFSYLVHGLEAPVGVVDVDLEAPDGGTWHFEAGEPGGQIVGRVAGSALDFCLVVTQRSCLADTSLTVTDGPAAEWMGIAQAYAGPPGPGRAPLLGPRA